MPNVLTHRVFAECNLEALVSSNLKSAIEKYPKAYILGSSGPDFFFYYNVWPWLDQKEAQRISKLGSIVHNQKINAFYNHALYLINQQKDKEVKQAMIAYLAGHLCHWSLDSVAHPYIFYRSGAPLKANQYWHYRFESMIDTMILDHVGHLKLKDYHPASIIESDAQTVQAVSQIYVPVMKEVYGVQINQNEIKKAVNDFSKVSRVLFDPNGWKFPLVSTLEQWTGKKWIFSSHMVQAKPNYAFDVLNLKHKIWVHPSHQEFTSDKSFIDLFNEGLVRAKNACLCLEEALDEGYRSEALLSLIADQDYETGMSDQKPMVNFACIYDEGEK